MHYSIWLWRKEAELFYELEKKDEEDQRDSGGGGGEDIATIE